MIPCVLVWRSSWSLQSFSFSWSCKLVFPFQFLQCTCLASFYFPSKALPKSPKTQNYPAGKITYIVPKRRHSFSKLGRQTNFNPLFFPNIQPTQSQRTHKIKIGKHRKREVPAGFFLLTARCQHAALIKGFNYD